MKPYLLLLLYAFSFSLTAQVEFEEERLNELLKSSINEFRLENNLEAYEPIEELDAAAFEQAAYLMKQSRLLHTQEDKKKATLKDRLIYYAALYSEAGENLAEVSVGAKTTVDKSGKKEIIETEEQAIKAAIQFWMDGGDSELNLKDPLFKHFGSAVVKEEERLILAVVMAGLPYTLPNEKSSGKIKTDLQPYDQQLCRDVVENHGTIPQLFSDAFKVEEDGVYFEFHSLATVDAILSDAADGIAVELVGDYQFECNEPNRLFPGEAQKGFLLPVAKKGKLSTLNQAKEKGAVRLKMADLPAEFKGIPLELNGFVLKDNHICFDIPYNQVRVENKRDWNLPFLYAGKSSEKSFSWQDTLVKHFPIPENKADFVDSVFEEIMTYANAFKFKANEINLKWKISPTQVQSSLKKSQQVLLQKLSELLDTNSINKEVEVQNKALSEHLKNTVYAIDVKNLSGEELKIYLHKEAVKDSSLAEYLKQLNQLQIELIGEANVDAAQNGNAKMQMLDRLVENRKIDQALRLQNDLIQNAPEKHPDLLNRLYHQESEFIELINNQIVLTTEMGKTTFKGNPLHLAFLEIYLVAKPTIVSYNKLLAELKYWAGQPSAVKQIDDWEKNFNKLKSSDLITKKTLARTALNYYAIAADYYYEQKDFNARRKAFDQLMKQVQLADLTQDEKLELGRFLCYQDQFDRAINLLLPEVQKEKVKAELLSFFLQIAIYDSDEVNSRFYLSVMQKFSESDSKMFCDFFSKNKRGIQALADYAIKELYCENCQAKANDN